MAFKDLGRSGHSHTSLPEADRAETGNAQKIWICVTKPGNRRRVEKHKIFGISQQGATVIRKVKGGDIVLVHVVRPINGVVAVYQVKRLLRGTKGVWDEAVYPYGIELEPAEGFKAITNPIPLSLLLGLSIGDVGVSPILKGVPIFEVPVGVLERIRSKRKRA